MRLLLIEDDPFLGASLGKALGRQGYVVDLARTGAEGLAALRAQDYAAALLDLALPDIDGVSVLRQARETHIDVPILIVSANISQARKIECLDQGADDYLVKPFDFDELSARLRVHIRRREGHASNALMIGDMAFDQNLGTVIKAGQRVTLTRKETQVLELLLMRRGRFIDKAQLENAVYDLNTQVESNTIEVIVHALRKKLDAGVIMTKRGFGYQIP